MLSRKSMQEIPCGSEYNGEDIISWLESFRLCRILPGFGGFAVHPAILVMVLRKLIVLAFFGFIIVMVAWPVLAALGILLGFALIGLLVWVPLRCLGFGRPIEWHKMRDASHKCLGAAAIGCNRVAGQIWNQEHPYLHRVRETGRYLARICRETMSGSLVGGMLGLIPAMQHGSPVPVLLGCCVGAFVGALVGLSSRGPARESVQPHCY